jgi:tetrahydromethanopterin S-methyltransferase subunit A
MTKYVFPMGFKWPVETGDYKVGDPSCSVAVCTLRSNIELEGPFAIKGTCFTENIGIEKIIVNIISNPNIRFLVLCGVESTGHYTGECIRNLKEYGIDAESKRILNSRGPLAFLRNIPQEAIDRFQKQIQVIDLIEVQEPTKINEEIKRHLRQEISAFPEEPMIITSEVKKKREKAIEIGDVAVIPELEIRLDPATSMISARS